MDNETQHGTIRKASFILTEKLRQKGMSGEGQMHAVCCYMGEAMKPGKFIQGFLKRKKGKSETGDFFFK